FIQSSRFMVQSSRFMVQSSRFMVQSSRFMVQSSRFKVQGSRFMVQGSWFKVRSSRLVLITMRSSRYRHPDAQVRSTCMQKDPLEGMQKRFAGTIIKQMRIVNPIAFDNDELVPMRKTN